MEVVVVAEGDEVVEFVCRRIMIKNIRCCVAALLRCVSVACRKTALTICHKGR